MDEKLIDQSQLAESISKDIKYDFADCFLVKQLDPIKVKKEFNKPVPAGKPSKDSNGVEAVDYDKIETEVKEVDSDFRKGVVLKLPIQYRNMENKPIEVKIGDVVLFREMGAKYFDLLKDSRLIKYYDIVAIAE